MANSYLVGEQTKGKILKESRKLFYRKGYTETTYGDISTVADVNRALIPYYFKSKQILGEEIYQQIITDFTDTLDEILDMHQFSPDFVYILHTVSYYRLLGNNDKLSRFAFQLSTDENADLFPTEQDMLSNLGGKFSNLPDGEPEILAKMSIGMKKEIIQMLANPENTADADQLARINLYMLMGYAGYSRKKMEELVDAAFEVADLLSFHIKNNFSIEIKYN